MNTYHSIQLKHSLNQMQDTHSESDTELKSHHIYGKSFSKIRQKVHWKLLLNNQVYLNNKYVILELIQAQKHFDLYRAMMLSSRQRVVVKIIDREAIRQSLIQNQVVENWQHQYQQFLVKFKIQNYAENKLFSKTSGVFLVQSIETFENADFAIKISENYYDRTLKDIINKRQSLPIEEALAIIKQLIFALAEFHKEGIILTELNPASIIHKNGVFKVCDFSSMRKVSQNFTSTLNMYHSYSYVTLIAPQLAVCPEIVDIKSQIWALGVLLYQMIAHNVPYEERPSYIIKQAKSHDIMFEMKSGQASEQVVSFMRQLLETDPDERISWKKLINHPIFAHKEYFYCPKMMPIVDARNTSLKKKQNDIIPQEIINPEFQNLRKDNKIITKIKYLDIKNAFKTVQECKKINIAKFIDVENETFLNIKQINLMALKVKYIFEEIIEKIENCELIDKKRRSHIEAMCMITQRCYQYMKKSRMFDSKSQDPRVDNYQEQLKTLFNKVKETCQKYAKEFQGFNVSPYYISNDLFSAFVSKKKTSEKMKYLRGQEGLDYTIAQQINYTQQRCINKMLNEMKGDNLMLQYVIINLKFYQAINQITLEDIEGKYTFLEVVDNIIGKKKNNK